MARKIASISTTETTTSDLCARPNHMGFSISKPATTEKAIHPTIPATTFFGENPPYGENGEVIFDISLE
eukprot:6918050-Ditylum_brightwellii.AAC.1